MTSSPTDPPDFAPFFSSREVLQSDLEQMRAIRRLRYQVYCVDCAFLEPADYPQEEESDEHDARSAHFCAFNQKQELVGYVRLVRPDSRGRLPFQDHGADNWGKPSDTSVDISGAASGEVSRLMVRQDYRRRRGDLLSGVTAAPAAGAVGPQHRNPSPQIMLSLYRQMYIHSLNHGVRHWYAAMERALARVLTQMGFGFRQIGPLTDYYGPVAPFLADLNELRTQLQARNPDLLRWFCDSDFTPT